MEYFGVAAVLRCRCGLRGFRDISMHLTIFDALTPACRRVSQHYQQLCEVVCATPSYIAQNGSEPDPNLLPAEEIPRQAVSQYTLVVLCGTSAVTSYPRPAPKPRPKKQLGCF